ncbi:hypothetical protein GAY28_19140 [Azospirillum brasilense]|nr:hypothetical protein [Azospirillum brasilense]
MSVDVQNAATPPSQRSRLRWRGYGIGIVLLIVALAALVQTSSGKTLLPPFLSFDQSASEHVTSMTVRASVAFVSAKSINAALSVAKSAQFSLGVVLSGSISPAQILDPLDELISQFSTILLYASASAAALRFVLSTITAPWVEHLALVGLALMAIGYARQPDTLRPSGRLFSVGLFALSLAVTLRIGLPAVLALSKLVSENYMTPEFDRAAAALAQAASDLAPPVTQGYDAIADYARRISAEHVWTRLGMLFDHTTTIITVMFLDIVVFPLALGWLGLRLFKHFFGGVVKKEGAEVRGVLNAIEKRLATLSDRKA